MKKISKKSKSFHGYNITIIMSNNNRKYIEVKNTITEYKYLSSESLLIYNNNDMFLLRIKIISTLLLKYKIHQNCFDFLISEKKSKIF